MKPLTEVGDETIQLVRSLILEASIEANDARWPGRAGDSTPAAGGDTSRPTERRGLTKEQGGVGPDTVNEGRAQAIRNLLTRHLAELQREKDYPKRRKQQIPRCQVRGCTDVAWRGSQFTRNPKDRCGACYEWERTNSQERQRRAV